MPEAREQATSLDAQVHTFIEESKRKLIETTVQPKFKFTLKKLPMWGLKATAEQINFEWPSLDMLAEMQDDVAIRSVTFRSNKFFISSICVKLTNGFSSPIFQHFGRNNQKHFQTYLSNPEM